MAYILFCIIIIIIIIITPPKYFFPMNKDVIDVFGHLNSWGKTSIVSRVNSTHKSIIKMYFGVSQENLMLFGWRIQPYWVIILLHLLV